MKNKSKFDEVDRLEDVNRIQMKIDCQEGHD